MVLPLVLGSASGAAHCLVHASHGGPWPAAWATVIHSAGYLGCSAAIAALVFEKLGVGLLRTAWLNLDLVWAIALVVTSVATMTMAMA
jgi:hypothetical protein